MVSHWVGFQSKSAADKTPITDTSAIFFSGDGVMGACFVLGFWLSDDAILAFASGPDWVQFFGEQTEQRSKQIFGLSFC